jgi:uncharacterized protein YdeI (YjbR/CyaY-like superfamily)
MPHTDPRVDAYIAAAAPFAQPILNHVRMLVHRVLPEVEEGIKWGMPAFMIGGRNLAGMAAFKRHCAVTIHGAGRFGESEGMGSCGKVTALSDLPGDEVLEAMLKAAAAARLEKQGALREPSAKRLTKPEIPVPADFAAAMAASAPAGSTFESLAPSHRREYLEWITEAKRPETRARRIAQAIQWLGEGKKRNWKYETR